MPQELIGASAAEEELYEHLVSHEAEERAMLDEYKEIAGKIEAPALRYLMGLIEEDEVRHHRVFQELAASLKAEVELRPEEPEIPRLGAWRDQVGVAPLIARLLEHEREDRKRLRRLERDLREVRDTTLWALLVTLMEMDTDKHIEILEFALKHTHRTA